jgi:hypothetical protein
MTNQYTKDDTIFVQIASYRDPELQHTLQDLFQKAKKPANIFVGICHQYDMKGEEDKHLFEVPFPRQEQLRIDEVDYRKSEGCCWARNRVQKLWKNEKWTLMIDSHMRFEDGWDEMCVAALKKLINCGVEKPILSHYPPGYDTVIESNGQCTTVYDSWLCRMRPEFRLFDNGNIPDLAQPPTIDYNHNFPLITPVVGACFLFSKSCLNQEVIYDKHIYFSGEEISMSVRLWTSGYTIFCPNKIIVYHLWLTGKDKNGNKFQDSNKHKKYSALPNRLEQISYARTKELFNTLKTNDPDALKEINQYGLGKSRALKDYARFSGIDFRKKETREHTKQGIFEEWQEVSKTKNLKNIFGRING